MNKTTIAITFLLFIAACTPALLPSPMHTNVQTATFDLHIMSQCPYGIQVEHALSQVKEQLGDALDLRIHFIGQGDANNLQSLHGENEVLGNVAQACVQKYAPQQTMPFISCMNENAKDIPNNWKSCAEKLSLDVSTLETCYASEGKELVAQSFAHSSTSGASASPTMFLNGEQYNGRRDATALMRAICASYGTKPSACASLPEPVTVEFTIINDKTCTTCDTTAVETALKGVFESVRFTTVDISSAEAKTLVEQESLQMLPAYIATKNIDTVAEWSQLQGAFTPTTNGYRLLDEATGATRFINAEAQAAYEQQLAEQKAQAQRQLGVGDTPQIDFFVMSYCPYGNQAEEAIKPAYDALKNEATFNPRYVISKTESPQESHCRGNYCSLHGVVELNQDVRELCVLEEYGIDKWFDFALNMNTACDHKNADTCWTSVAQTLGLDDKRIATCENDKGLDLLEEQTQLNELLSVSGSPTVFVNGELYEGSRSAAGYQRALCATMSPQPEICASLPDEPEPSAAPAGGGCGL